MLLITDQTSTKKKIKGKRCSAEKLGIFFTSISVNGMSPDLRR